MSNFSISLLVSAVFSWMFAGAPAENVEQELTVVDTIIPALDTPLQELHLPYPNVYTLGDTSKIKSNPNNRIGDPTRQSYVSPLFLPKPTNFSYEYELAEDGEGFNIYERVGSVNIRRPSYISYEDYIDYRREQGVKDYYREQGLANNAGVKPGLIPTFDLGSVSDIFGGGTVSIRPTGFATLEFSVDRNVIKNDNLPIRQQRNLTFNFDQQIQLGVVGEIGKLLNLNATFDTQATFDFENELKLKWEGTEDQILQSVEAGNVSLQLGNSLIQGRQNLFGLKTRLRFGPVYVTAIASTERGEVQSITIPGGNEEGGIQTPFDKDASEYDLNKHFFLSHYFRSRYEAALANLPIINSNVRVNRIEVWIERGGSTRDTRNGIGFTDLGETEARVVNALGDAETGIIFNDALINDRASQPFPDNNANDLFQTLTNNAGFRDYISSPQLLTSSGFQNTVDFEIAGNMRKLNESEYRLNQQLGYISLNSAIPTDQVLFVAFEYTINGRVFQVGEFSQDVPSDGLNSNVLFLKLLKPSVLRPTAQDPITQREVLFPPWDLMMKNIYNIGFGIKQDGFFLDIQYESGTSAGKINYIPEGNLENRPFLQVLRLDQLTNNTAPGPDFRFDFVSGLTIIPENGLVVFPVLEPFGSHLAERLGDANDSANFAFQPLYDFTQADAEQQFPHLDRYSLQGFYQGSGSGGAATGVLAEYPLPSFNLSEGSVVVRQGGTRLTEGVDYRVDYFGGKVEIINPRVVNGPDISVDFETSSSFNLQTRTLLGARAEYLRSEKFTLGTTILNLREQPFNRKPILGEEPINNTIWGLDGGVRTESDFLTKLIDKLPLISTKETSNIQASGEFAQFLPGQPAVVKNDEERGFVFLDDFEALENQFSLQGFARWRLASIPNEEGGAVLNAVQSLPNATDSLALGYTRAKFSWYQIDPTIYQGVLNIPQDDLENNFTRRIDVNEIFPTARRAFGTGNQFTFDLRFRPEIRGPYNYQADPSRINPDGNFANPRENWGGIMRDIDIQNDFEANNVEFLEFWVLDPFQDNPSSTGGDLYIDLGLINEDVLPDAGLSRENGLPPDGMVDQSLRETIWGRVPIGQPAVNAFSNEGGSRPNQDIGLDGLNDADEAVFFSDFLSQLQAVAPGSPGLAAAQEDPSTDNFVHYREDDFDAVEAGILERYENFNGTEGNTPIADGNNQNRNFQGSTIPDTEDINENGSLNFAEQYWEYRVSIRPQDLRPGSNFVVDSIQVSVPVGIGGGGGNRVNATWYQFRVPIASGRPVNGITNFKSINFMRLYMTDFAEEVILRTTEFQFISTQWRRFLGNLRDNGQVTSPPEPPFAEFEIGTLSIEENSRKVPFPYVLPPNVIQQAINGNTQAGFLQNERSIQLIACNLDDGDARSTFKLVNQDLRQYERLRMWVHAEPFNDGPVPANFDEKGDVEVFLRLGLDNEFNYYEYVLPVQPSALGFNSRDSIWANEFNFRLSDLSTAKRRRDSARVGIVERFEFEEELPLGEKIVVKGTPKLSDIRNIMIGIRNPADPGGQPVCVEIWANELRLTDFDQESGWAAQGNLSMRLADVASIDANVRHQTQGFGPLEQKITSRPLSQTTAYNFRIAFNLDKLFPKRWGLRLPISADYGERKVRPVFDPQEADVRTDELVRGLNREERRSVIAEIRDFTRTRGLALNGWRKLRVGDNVKQNFWDIENFDFTLAYNEELFTSSVIERRFSNTYRGAINYRYNFQPFNWQPFTEGGENNLLKLINISPLPTSITVSLTGDRRFEERRLRNQREGGLQIPPTFQKNFLLTRNYNLAWSLTKNLQLNFNATNNARVDEVQGFRRDATPFEIDSVGTLRENLLTFGRSVDTVISTFNGEQRVFIRRNPNLINMGRTTNYRHSLNATYTLPFAQFPITNWINGNASYSATFDWQQAPEINPDFGATITNTQAIQGNARLNLKGLFSKIKPLKEVLDEYERKGRQKQSKNRRRETGPGNEEARPTFPVAQPEEKVVESDTTKGRDPFFFLKKIGYQILRLAMSVQNVDLTYSQNAGTVLPGFLPSTDNFGLDFRYESPFENFVNGRIPPTAGFILGSQRDIRNIAAQNGWITQDTLLSNLFLQNRSTQFTGRTSIELFRGFRLELSVQRNKTENNSSFFRFDPSANGGAGGYREIDPFSTGTFSMTYVFINSAFESFRPESSEAFDRFSANRQVISERRIEETTNTNILSREGVVRGGYQNGFLGNNQSVLIPAFLSAYGVIGPNSVSLDNFPRIPLPNWSVNYNGLSNIPFIQEIFSSITLRHTYRATYTIGGFNNNLGVGIDPLSGLVTTIDTFEVDANGEALENIETVDIINNIQIREDFAPLLGINMTLKNGVTASVDYKRGRSLNFSTGTLQLNELRNQDLAVSVGYRKDQLNWQFRFMGKDVDLQNSMNVNFRLTMRDTRELNRNLAFEDGDEELTIDPQFNRGTRNWIISPSVDYVVSNRINVKVFFEQNINEPFTSQTFPTNFASGGFQIRFTLSE